MKYIKQKTLRPYKRAAWFTALGVIGLVSAWWANVTYEHTTKDMLMSALSYIPQGNSKVHSDVPDLLTGNVRLLDRVALKGDFGMESEIYFDSDGKPFIDSTSVRLNASETLLIPSVSSALASLIDPNFFYLKPLRRKVGVSHTFRLRAEKKAREIYLYSNYNPFLVIESGFLDRPKEVVTTLERVCAKFKKVSCDELYNHLARELSTDKNYYLNKMEDRYDTVLSGDEFKILLNSGNVMIEKESFKAMSKHFKKWVNDVVAKSLSKDQFTNIDNDRGGVVLSQAWLVSELFESDDFRTDVLGTAKKMQYTPYDISGIISDVKTEGNVTRIHLMDSSPRTRQRALAAALIALLGLISLLYGVWCLLFPIRYPHRTDVTHTSAISR